MPYLQEEPKDRRKDLGRRLTEALKLVLLIGLVVMAFGPSYSYALIRLLYGRKWSDGEASSALRYYCLYVMLLAMNGLMLLSGGRAVAPGVRFTCLRC